jgi:hypothetical protein
MRPVDAVSIDARNKQCYEDVSENVIQILALSQAVITIAVAR